MGKRRSITDDDAVYYSRVVDRDIQEATRAIAAAETPDAAQDAIAQLEELIPRRARLRLLQARTAGSASKKKVAGSKPRVKKVPRAEPTAEAHPRPTAAPPVAPPVIDQTEEQRTWNLRIDSAIRQAKFESENQLNDLIDFTTGGRFQDRAALQAAPEDILQTLHRAILAEVKA